MKKIKWSSRIPVFIILGMVFIIMTPYILLSNIHTAKLSAVKGVVDFEGRNLGRYIYEINGEVETYRDQLLYDGDFKLKDEMVQNKGEYTPLPIAWDIEENTWYATHRIQLKGLVPGRHYGFQMMEALTAFRVYADGRLFMENGRVSTSREETEGEADPGIGIFVATSDQMDILIQVANKEAFKTGVWQKIYFGEVEQIQLYQETLVRRDAFVIGCILIMAVYHMLLYIVMGRDKTILYFASFCFLVAIKSAFSGQQLGYIWFPVSYGIGLRIAYLMIPLMTVSVMEFILECFPRQVNKSWVRVTEALSVIQAAVILLAPQAFYQGTFLPYQLLLFISAAAILVWILKATYMKEENALLYAVGFLSFFMTGFNDILYSMMILKTGYMLGVGLFILILSQATLLAYRIRAAYEQVERVRNDLETIVVERTQQIEDERKRYEYLSKIDGLTNIYNRRFLSELMAIELESFKRYKTVFSLIITDIDFFKHVNDTYGHLVGDEILAQFAQLLKNNSRRTDVVGRFGGEEFLILMRFANEEEAEQHAENLRRKIETAVFETKAGPLKITASFGVCTIGQDMVHIENMLKNVDDALYKAKSNGRNRVETL